MNWFSALSKPGDVAVIGATESPGKAGRLLMLNLAASENAGHIRLHPINPSKDQILGKKAHAAVSALDASIDMAVIVLPAARVIDALIDCGKAKVPVVIVISGGFSETGPEGAAYEAELLRVARDYGIRVLGPNCFGFINAGIGMNASISGDVPHSGGISIVTQSGAYGMSTICRSQDDHIGFSKVISLGNAADINETDVLAALADDRETAVICMLLESIQGGRRFFEVLSATCQEKPVVVLKTGKSASGQRAAQSHTAALTGDVTTIEAGLQQAGAHVVDDGIALIDVAHALLAQPRPRGPRVGIITNSGGVGVEVTDLLEKEGLLVPELSPDLRKTLDDVIPAHGSSSNPIDITTDWSRFKDMYVALIQALAGSDEVDIVVPVLLHRSAQMPEVIDAVSEIASSDAIRATGKPIHVCWVAPDSANGNRLQLIDRGIPCHRGPRQTALVVGGTQTREPSTIPLTVGQSTHSVEQTALWLDTDWVYQTLSVEGLPLAPWAIVRDPEAALARASEFGYPVVVKALSKDIVHKSDAGAVLLNINTPEALASAYNSLETRFSSREYLIQKQIQSGTELVIGARRDNELGPIIVAGIGGVLIELINDVAVRLAPVDEREAASMIDELHLSQLFDGFRGRPAISRKDFSRLVAKVSAWFSKRTDLCELDLNPVIAVDNGFQIVDARVSSYSQPQP